MNADDGPVRSDGHTSTGRPTLSTVLVTFDDSPIDVAQLLDVAVAADRAGIDRLLVSDHVVFGETLQDYGRPELGGTAGGRQPTGPDGNWLEPLTVLSAVAARTDRVRLGTNILLAALRRPAVLAKTISTLDVISGGRFDLGVGIGWQRAEYEAAGLQFDERGDLLDHTLAVLLTLWNERVATFDDRRLGFSGIHQMPKPLRPGGVPIWIGGSVNRRVARRIARFGDGWIPWGEAASAVTTALPQMRRLIEAEGGDPSRLAVAGNLPWVRDASGEPDPVATMERVPDLLEIGITDLRAHFRPSSDPSETRDVFASAVDAFRAVTATRGQR